MALIRAFIRWLKGLFMSNQDDELSDDLRELKSAYSGVGAIVVHWQLLENVIEIALVYIFHKFGGSNYWNNLPPTSTTSKKIGYLREAENFPAISKYKDELHEIVDEIYRLKTTRDDLVHGSLRSPKMDGTIYKFTKAKLANNVYQHFHMLSSISNRLAGRDSGA
jgi:hypothetical protein